MRAFHLAGGWSTGIVGALRGGCIVVESFCHGRQWPVQMGSTLYCDVLRLYAGVEEILSSRSFGQLDAVSISARGDEFGLLDEGGYLLENPVHRSDARTRGMLEHAHRRIPSARLCEITGNPPREWSIACQLLALRENRVGLLGHAAAMLPLPDLLAYFLSGKAAVEAGRAAGTGLLDIRSGDWSTEAVAALGLPRHIFPPVTPAGTVLGELSPALCERLQCPPAPVIAAGGPVQSAQLAVPAQEPDFAFLYEDTDDFDVHCVMGAELPAPPATDTARREGFCCTPAFGDAHSLHKELAGLHIPGACALWWTDEEGYSHSLEWLEHACQSHPPFRSLIDPGAPEFREPGDLPARIRAFCERTGQALPQDPVATTRCVFDSLALQRRAALEALGRCTGRTFRTLYVMGTHTGSALLGQMTADACGVDVLCPSLPREGAAALGNVTTQLLALGALQSVEEARAAISRSFPSKRYTPRAADAWNSAYQQFQEVCKC